MNLQILFIAMLSCFFFGSVIAPVSILRSTSMDRAVPPFFFSYETTSRFPMQARRTKAVKKIERINAGEYWRYFYLQQISLNSLAIENER